MRCALLSLLALLALPASAAELDFGKGTFQAGGSATLDLYLGGGDSMVALLLAPRGGWFATDDLEIVAGLGITLVDYGSSVSVSGGVRYFLPAKTPWPVYVGGSLSYGSVGISGFDYLGDTAWLTGEGGILLPLNEKVALDLGGRLDIYLDDAVFHVPVGYFGVQAFFP